VVICGVITTSLSLIER